MALYDPQPTSTLLTNLTNMREYLSNSNRWTKGFFNGFDGQVCLLGAYGAVTDQTRMHPGQYMREVLEKGDGREVLDTLYDLVKRPESAVSSDFARKCEAVWAFNDAGLRKHEEVLELLDKAIEVETAKLSEAAYV